MLHGRPILKGEDKHLHVLAQEVWHPDHGSLVVSPQSSDLLSQHLYCDHCIEVADSGVVLGVRHVDRVEVDLAFFVLLDVLWFDLISLHIHLLIMLIDECADDMILGEEAA